MVTVVCVRVVTIMCEREVTVIECAIGGLPKCPKFMCSGHTFQGCTLLLILINSTIGGTFSKSAEKNIFIFFLFQGASVMSK